MERLKPTVVGDVVKTGDGSYNLSAYDVKPGRGEVQDPPAPPSLSETLKKVMNGEVEGAGRATDALYQ